ncbi:hypothetical protein [Mesorhizobium loti]|uniref:hypothetical protein n=1 Tax=Rhizobium loti TaxID=381 RepID=UPI001FD8E3C7|nr:hypothetical protein [Mesorhizobium loti]
MLRLQHQVGMVTRINRDDSLEGDADAGKLRRNMGKAVRRAIKIDDQTLHVLIGSASRWRDRLIYWQAALRNVGFFGRTARAGSGKHEKSKQPLTFQLLEALPPQPGRG